MSDRPTVDDLVRAVAGVVGQEEAKERLAVLLLRQLDVADGVYPESFGAVGCGPTGSGKTMLIKAMCEASGLPFAEANATQFTEKGFAGPDLTQMFIPLLKSAAAIIDGRPHTGAQLESRATKIFGRRDFDEVLELAQTGVVFLDEFDKRCKPTADAQGRDIGKALQAELLKIMEGSQEWVTESDDELGELIDTRRILILAAGAFVGLTKIIKHRLEDEHSATLEEGLYDHLRPPDFITFGMIPELAGRFTTHIVWRPLRGESMLRILRAGGLLEEFHSRFAAHGVELEIGEGALVKIGDVAAHQETGARGLRNVLETLFAKALYQAARKRRGRVVVTAAAVDPPSVNLILPESTDPHRVLANVSV